MKTLLSAACISLISVLAYTSCTNSTAESTASQAVVEAPVQATMVASLDIEGMTCAAGCAMAIESQLNKLEGVEMAAVNFEDRAAAVTYNSAVISQEDIIAAVHAVNDGHYKVTDSAVKPADAKPETERPATSEVEKPTKPRNADERQVESSKSTRVSFPNIFDALLKFYSRR